MKNVDKMFEYASFAYVNLMNDVYAKPFDTIYIGQIMGIRLCLFHCFDLESVAKIDLMMEDIKNKFGVNYYPYGF